MIPQARRIIEKFGGITALARALDKQTLPSVVQGWNDRGFIPARRQQEVLDAARRLGIDLTPADFFDLPSTPQDFLDQGGGEAA